MTGFQVFALVLVVALCRLKLHIMRVSPGHPCHEQVCRNPQCVCRRIG